MQKSKSIFSFAPTTEHTEVSSQARFRRRSSLDRFVIPGRTRLPSSETSKSSISSQDATDFQIAQALLNRRNMPPSMPASIKPNPHISDRSRYELVPQKPPPSMYGSWQHTIDPHSTPRPVTRRGRHQPSQIPSNEQFITIVPHRGAETRAPRTMPHRSVMDTTADLSQHQTDGLGDTAPLRHIQSAASMSWSHISRRGVSNSSGGSLASRASELRRDYNILAENHGFSPLTGDLSCEGNKTSPKTADRKPRRSWRKFFHRSASAFNLKNSHSNNAPTNILTGRTLEETSRLGGLGFLMLPPEFAVDKLAIPRSLSVTGAYILEHGCNAPGIFRVPGTTTTVNKLYAYYDREFSEAGSPSKVEETVGTGLFPSDPMYTLNDIASLFKKIINGLPGGLLDSPKLFEALRSVLLDCDADVDSSLHGISQIRARAVALAISSVSSRDRVHLIQAVVGLVAYLGFEGDKVQTNEKLAAKSQNQQSQSRSEIMGYKSLSQAFGPLLLGQLIDSIDMSPDRSQAGNGALGPVEHDHEQNKKSKKPADSSVPNKIENDATLVNQVKRTNLTIDLMHSLLTNWQEITKQFRELNGLNCSDPHVPRDKIPYNNQPRRAASGLTLRNSEEEAQLHTILRGRALPRDLSAAVEGRISSRSPSGRRTVEFSLDSNASRTWLPEICFRDNDVSPAGSNATQSTAPRGPRSAIESTMQNPNHSQAPFTEDISRPGPKERTESDRAMERMSNGTILKPRDDSSTSFEQVIPSRNITPIRTPRKQSRTSSSSYQPETAIRRVPTPAQRQTSKRFLGDSVTEKPLPPEPPIDIAQKTESHYVPSPTYLKNESHESVTSNRKSPRSRSSAESSPLATRRPTPRTLFPSREQVKLNPPPPRDSEDRTDFPPRQSSLLQDPPFATLPIDSVRTFETMEAYNAYHDSRNKSSSPRPASPKTSGVLRGPDLRSRESERESTRNITFQRRNFSETSRATLIDEQARPAVKAQDITTVYAHVRPNPLERSADDPFVFSAHISPSRKTKIPSPVRDVGHSRKLESSRSAKRMPSPRKQALSPTPRDYPPNRISACSVARDTDAEIVRANGKISNNTSHDVPTDIAQQMSLQNTQRMGSCQADAQGNDAYDSRPFSFESAAGTEGPLEEPNLGPINLASIQSVDTVLSQSQRDAPAPHEGHLILSSLSRVNSLGGVCDAAKKLERHGSVNSALYQKNTYLQRKVEQLLEEKQALIRRIDAATEAKSTEARALELSNPSSRGSWTKDMFNEEVKELKQDNKELRRNVKGLTREKTFLERRVQELERVLANGGLADSIMKRYNIDVDALGDGDEGNNYEEKGKGKMKDGAAAGNDLKVRILLDVDGEKPESEAHLYQDEGWGSRDLEVDGQIDGH